MENEIIWTANSSGLISRFLNNIGLSSSTYEITNDELILKEGFLSRNTKVIKLSNLKDPKLVESFYQRLIKVGTIYLRKIDDNKIIILKNLKDPEEQRKKITEILKKYSYDA